MERPPPVKVRFRGRIRTADPNEPLSHVLGKGPFSILQRSIRYHRPRAPFCGVGYCTQCLVRVNDAPNVRSCRYLPKEGDVIETENAWPRPGFDLLGALDWIFPKGIDTVHGFRRPVFLTPLYHRVVRRLAGYGELPRHPPERPPSSVGPPTPTDVLVVGAGRAGRAAAERLEEHGVSTIVIERERAALPLASLRAVHVGTTAVFLSRRSAGERSSFGAIVVPEGRPALAIIARAVILSPGGYDASLFFAGNDRPGVVVADQAERAGPVAGPRPFRRALLFGGGPRAAEMLRRFGESVEAVASFGSIDPEVTLRASELGIPLYPRTILLRADGRARVRSVRLRSRGGETTFSLSVDAVVLAHRRLPNAQLFFQLGARMHWEPSIGHYLPDLSDTLETTVPGLFAAGEAAGFPPDGTAAESGTAAANAAAGRPGAPAPPRPPSRSVRAHELEAYYREFLRFRPSWSKCIVCPCEDVLMDEVEEAHRLGYRGIEVIKRFTGAGTGLCQGRYCIPDALLLLALLEGRPANEVGYITQRPPVVPTPLSALAALPEEVGT
jgi:sarcosine oxidase, subunit alpha